ncbi:glycoside hydrolase family 43 protein [Lactiplantibacillus daoliensis]|uniref:Glycoside hydrolase family 43 protein n=1 Tax=Lactiplantibacillus daoliensis TaxID=2559916 RepID=A0ABW1UHN8_9LACO|nr:glycoside hydrolase family 43 protein [Lactiplantibacillus daoliensis]
MNKNGQMWLDDQGKPIQAHGGMIAKFEDHYYWYGEEKSAPNIQSSTGGNMVPMIGIACYQSNDLQHWQACGIVLGAANDPSHTLNERAILERPKVVYNRQNHQYVMWCHYDTEDYHYAGCCVSVADSPTGPFTVKKIFKPNFQDSRDMTLYQEGDQVYLLHSSAGNQTMILAELTTDYCDTTGRYTRLFIDQAREAPTMFKTADWYFTITSGCTGWRPNPALFSRSHQLWNGAKLIDNPCNGPRANRTFDGQPTFVFSVGHQFYLLLDHWQPTRLSQSGYSILPIIINDRDLVVPWSETPFGKEGVPK